MPISPPDHRAQFHSMTEGNRADWAIIANNALAFNKGLPARIISHLRLLDGDYGGFAIDRLQHSLQTATRAARDGRDDEYVVCALLHDIGDTLGSFNHAEIAAAILKPFVSEKNFFLLEKHGIFQGYYFFEFLGLDRDLREQYRDHVHFDYVAEFCERYDQNSFDPSYDTMTIEAFVPMVERVMRAPRQSIYMAPAGDQRRHEELERPVPVLTRSVTASMACRVLAASSESDAVASASRSGRRA